MAGHRFFLSYARQDRDGDAGGAIDRLYTELVDDIRGKTGLPPDDIGFLDTHDIQSGERWPGSVEDGLRTCDAFVPVLSPTLFKRQYCGKEWTVFANRLRAHAGATKPPPLIQPVLFVGPQWLKGMPQPVKEIDFAHETYPGEYLELGLKKLVDLDKTGPFRGFVNAFADRLLTVIDAHTLPEADAIPPLEQVADAFSAGLPGAPATGGGAGWIQFILVAPHRDEVGDGRLADGYGDDAREWRPWLPDVPDALPMITLDLAHRERLAPEWLEADDHVVERIEEAFDLGKLVVVLVDAWSLGIGTQETRVRRLDTRDYMNCITAVLWNDRDPGTAAARSELEAKLRLTLANKCAGQRPHAFFARISSADELHRRLSPALARAAAHMREHLQVLRRAQGPQGARPEIHGPGGAPV